jgi:hypothetical protein
MTTAREDSIHLANLLRREHHALAEFLIALSAFDHERRWAELGYASLFSFLTRELHLSAGAAQYRKTATALIQRYPAIEEALRDGRLCLSSTIALAKVITRENATEVVPRFFGLSSRDAEFLAASIRPVENPPRRDFMVTPVRDATGIAAQVADRPPTGSVAPGASLELRAPEVLGPATATSVSAMASPAHQRPTIRPLDAERARVNMTVSRRLLDKLAAARDALSHSHPNASEEEILELGLDLIIQRHAKRRGLGAKPRKAPHAKRAPSQVEGALGAAAAPPSSKRSRHVPAEVWRAVWERDGGRCAWPLEGGGVCGSTRQIELDHIRGWARGAPTTVEECRLLCRPHQIESERRLYGDEEVDRYARRKGGRCSEPVAVYGLDAW